eukprot:CAMPEP_0172619610 /NCGR_PEP_ID=MMETSP1068-20121228/94982_1 /TAXON_ID=35684 /ORGANISM="Pseudopedinella elastica, Strain CCMP716" /LENGTH=146 /DNA_ID=CAMNT_0013426443 /DNA_START=130 /DNA_END=566 /DNA_ORIENTATION=+
MAQAVAEDFIEANGLAESVEVSSRGLTDRYSDWGSGAEPRMLAAANVRCGDNKRIRSALAAHKSRLLSEAELRDPGTILFLVTRQHESWTRDVVGSSALEEAKRDGRLRMLHSGERDVADPYFGDEELYQQVCSEIIRETPMTLAG